VEVDNGVVESGLGCWRWRVPRKPNTSFKIFAIQDLNAKFGTLISSKHINQVVLSGPNTAVVYKLLISDSPHSTKIGKGWKEFCNQHQFKEGDRVLFQVM